MTDQNTDTTADTNTDTDTNTYTDTDAGNTPSDDGGGKPEPFNEDIAKAKISKVNSEARALRARAKAAEAKVTEMEDAGKSELQKATDTAASAEKRAQEAEQRSLRLEVAAEKQLSPAQAKRLVGTTKEELEADAEELIDSFKTPEDEKGKGPGRKPKERLRGGTEPDEEPEEMDPRKLAAKISRDAF